MLHQVKYYGDKYSIVFTPHTRERRKNSDIPRDTFLYPSLCREFFLKALQYGLTSFRGKLVAITALVENDMAISMLVKMKHTNDIDVVTVLSHPRVVDRPFLTTQYRINLYMLVFPFLNVEQCRVKRVEETKKPKRHVVLKKPKRKLPRKIPTEGTKAFAKYELDTYKTTYDYKRQL